MHNPATTRQKTKQVLYSIDAEARPPSWIFAAAPLRPHLPTQDLIGPDERCPTIDQTLFRAKSHGLGHIDIQSISFGMPGHRLT